ncbi:hypothetical protein ABZT03_28565 [Streptomyces sp. NPDC005574]|uniref:hypothetical protein n=1 Tax=Streptomyces sp. NPDC005574 TaxID=3156891 RepID=UPI0033B43703
MPHREEDPDPAGEAVVVNLPRLYGRSPERAEVPPVPAAAHEPERRGRGPADLL